MTLKKHKLWIEFEAIKPTEEGEIELKRSIRFINALAKIGGKFKFKARIRGIPKDVLDYEPSGKTIRIEKLSDIVEKLTPEQFEMFLPDLRKWIAHGREIKKMKDNPEEMQKFANGFGCEIKTEENWKYIEEGMRWLDTGEHKVKTTVHFES